MNQNFFSALRSKFVASAPGSVVMAACFCSQVVGQTAERDAVAANLAAEAAKKSAPVSIEVARDRARLMSEIYIATLDVIHDRYFHGDRAIVPARAMEDVFSEVRRKYKVEARWISASLKPMSINHEPKTDFEKRAAKEIDQGKTEIESIDKGLFLQATAIPMGSSCIGCHAGLFSEPSKTPKFAGLVISIPILESETKTSQ